MKKIIYVKILDEDIDVWKPTEAIQIDNDIYKIIDIDEELEFSNGDLVKVENKIFSDGDKGLIAYKKYTNTN